jgi:hypothetical protein
MKSTAECLVAQATHRFCLQQSSSQLFAGTENNAGSVLHELFAPHSGARWRVGARGAGFWMKGRPIFIPFLGTHPFKGCKQRWREGRISPPPPPLSLPHTTICFWNFLYFSVSDMPSSSLGYFTSAGVAKCQAAAQATPEEALLLSTIDLTSLAELSFDNLHEFAAAIISAPSPVPPAAVTTALPVPSISAVPTLPPCKKLCIWMGNGIERHLESWRIQLTRRVRLLSFCLPRSETCCYPI